MKFKSSIVLAALSSVVLSVPAMAQLQINPFPMGGNQDAQPAKDKPKSLIVPAPVLEARENIPDAMGGEDVILPIPETLEPLTSAGISKTDRERALLDSVNVPRPGSAYFDDAVSNADTMPSARGAVPAKQPLVARKSAAVPSSLADPVIHDLEPIDLKRVTVQTDSSGVQDAAAADIVTPVPDVLRPAAGQPKIISNRPDIVPRADHSRLIRLDMENRRIERLDGTVIGAAPGSVEKRTPAPLVASMSAAPVGEQGMMKSWSASEGDSIRSVLQQWAVQENVELIWDSMNEFAVLDSFSMKGPFADAVKALLDQYLEGNVRPVAKLHVDPASQGQILVVQVEGL